MRRSRLCWRGAPRIGPGRVAPTSGELAGAGALDVGASPGESLEAFMSKVRQRAAEARPERVPMETIEGQDPRLAAALAAAIARPEPETYRVGCA